MVDAVRARVCKAGKPRKAPAGGAARRAICTAGVAEAAEGVEARCTGGAGGPSLGASPAGGIALEAVLAADAVRALTMPHGAVPAGVVGVSGAARPGGSALRRNTHRAARPQEGRQLHWVPITAATYPRKGRAAAAAVKKVR